MLRNKLQRVAIGLVATALCGAGTASAQNLDLEEVGAALALPVITGAGESATLTAVTITNAGPAVRLQINVISGDPEDQWASQDFSCVLTAAETVLFVYEPRGFGESFLNFECDEGFETDQVQTDIPLNTRNGIMFVALEDPTTGETINSNQIFGDAVVIDFLAGAAFSVGAIPFQGVSPSAPGVGDRKYRFDNQEYTEFPSVLATNFIAPGGLADVAALVLFTLDGTVGASETPPAQVSIKFYNDDEVQFSAGFQFDCFAIVSLADIDGRFVAGALGSEAGHLTLTPELVSYPNVAHDAQFDGGGVIGVRKTPVHGWIFQTIQEGDLRQEAVANFEKGLFDAAAWGRTLAQSRLALMPHTGDTPVLNAP